MDLNQRITAILEKAKLDIMSNLDSKKITAGGKTKDSMKVIERGGHIMLVKNGGAPLETTEAGRKAGKVPKGFNAIIQQWIKDKGIRVDLIPYKTDRPHKYTVQERSEKMAAGAMAYTIIHNGTKRHREPRNDVYSPVVDEVKKEVENVISDLMITTIKTN